MTPSQIYRKTMVFNWYKLGLGVLTFFVCALFFSATWFAANHFAVDIATMIGLCCGAFLCAVAVYYIIMVKQGYSIKIGHLAVIEHALRTDSVPSNPIAFSKNVVQQRFGSSARYYLFSRDLDIATTQISRVIARGFSLDSDTPDFKTSFRLMRFFSIPALHLVDECCMAYALRRTDYEVNAACIDALTCLTINWRNFMSVAFRMSLLIYAFVLIVAGIVFIPGYAVCNALNMSVIPWIGMSLILAIIFKLAFLDSYVLTKMVCSFLDLTLDTKIEPKHYAKLDHWSKTYAKLRKAAEKAAEKAEDEADRAEREAARNAKNAKALPAAKEPEPVNDEKAKEPQATSDQEPPQTSEPAPDETEKT